MESSILHKKTECLSGKSYGRKSNLSHIKNPFFLFVKIVQSSRMFWCMPKWVYRPTSRKTRQPYMGCHWSAVTWLEWAATCSPWTPAGSFPLGPRLKLVVRSLVKDARVFCSQRIGRLEVVRVRHGGESLSALIVSPCIPSFLFQLPALTYCCVESHQ